MAPLSSPRRRPFDSLTVLSEVEEESRNLFLGGTKMSWMPASAGITAQIARLLN